MLIPCFCPCAEICCLVIITSDSEWDFYWCDVGWLRENFDHIYMEEHVRICHFRNHYEVGALKFQY